LHPKEILPPYTTHDTVPLSRRSFVFEEVIKGMTAFTFQQIKLKVIMTSHGFEIGQDPFLLFFGNKPRPFFRHSLNREFPTHFRLEKIKGPFVRMASGAFLLEKYTTFGGGCFVKITTPKRKEGYKKEE